MTRPRDPDAILAAWLEEGPNAGSPSRHGARSRSGTRTHNPTTAPVLDVALEEPSTMNPIARIAVAAIVAVVLRSAARSGPHRPSVGRWRPAGIGIAEHRVSPESRPESRAVPSSDRATPELSAAAISFTGYVHRRSSTASRRSRST